jgi:hypothetical protein
VVVLQLQLGQLQAPLLYVCCAGAMRSHLHLDQSKDVWSVELKIPRQMAPVTLGFVLWNAGQVLTTASLVARRVGRGT